MSKTRRERVQTITRGWGVTPVDGWQATVKEELRALWAREELLDAVVEATCGLGLNHRTLRIKSALKDLFAHDNENPR